MATAAHVRAFRPRLCPHAHHFDFRKRTKAYKDIGGSWKKPPIWLSASAVPSPGEHGDGQARAELLPKMFGPNSFRLFANSKPFGIAEWRMNPGKLVEPYRMDENLKVHPELRVWQPPTHFHF